MKAQEEFYHLSIAICNLATLTWSIDAPSEEQEINFYYLMR